MQLTRRALYDLVWSKPMIKVAADFQISDVGLANICERHRVPTPPRGYWAKVEAGRKVKKALFVQVDDAALDQIDIGGNLNHLPEPVRELAARRKAERLGRRTGNQMLFPPLSEPIPPKPIGEIYPTIRLTAKTLRSRAAQHDGVARAFGDGLCGVEIGIQSVERAIDALDDLAHCLAERDLQIEPTGNGMRIVMGPEKAQFNLKELTRNVPHEPTEAELAVEARQQKRRERYGRGEIPWSVSLYEKAYPDKDTLRTGQLFLQIEGYSDGVRRKWADGKTQTIKALIPSVVDGIEVLLAVRKAERERREQRERRWQEYCRRRDLAKARQKRDADRGLFVDRIIETHREIARLRDWLAESRPIAEQRPNSGYQRMVEWTQAKLEALVASVEAAGIEEQLTENKLFPEQGSDDLHDPLGDPEERYYWEFD
jgi:hypothetical protein